MRAIGKGADGVAIGAWYRGECDYETGNLVAERNVQYTKEILKTTGISPERVQIFHCSAAEGQKFQEEANRITSLIRNLKKNPIKESIKSAKKANTSEDKKKEK